MRDATCAARCDANVSAPGGFGSPHTASMYRACVSLLPAGFCQNHDKMVCYYDPRVTTHRNEATGQEYRLSLKPDQLLTARCVCLPFHAPTPACQQRTQSVAAECMLSRLYATSYVWRCRSFLPRSYEYAGVDAAMRDPERLEVALPHTHSHP